MINALPSDKSQSKGSLPSMPGTASGGSNSSVPPVHQSLPTPPMITTPPATTPTPAAQPHGQVSNLSQSLSAKIHGSDPVGSPAGITLPPTPPSQPDKSLESPMPKKPFRFNGKGLVAALVLGLVIAGGGAGYYLNQRNQDIRQQAASEEVTGTEQSRTATEWGVFNQQWNDILKNSENDWEASVEYARQGGARYKCDEKIMTVGDETLYGCDLNALFILYEPEAYIQPAAISAQDPALNRVLDGLITNSGLLQEAQKRNLITLDETIYNSPSKDSIRRMDTLRELREQIGSSFDKTVDFEAVVIYFHNQLDPKIPLAEAQAAAKAKMDVLYERLKNGEITMEQAGQEIAADNIQGDTTGVSLANLDPIYADNAYSMHKSHVFDTRFFKDETLDEELKSLGENQMSTVRLCKDYKFTDAEMFASIEQDTEFNPPLVDSCYIIFKVNKINFGWMEEGSQTNSGEEFVKQNYGSSTTKMMENLKQ